LRRLGARPKRLGHQRQLLLAGPATPPFGLRQDLGHRFYGHLKRGRKDLFIGQRGLTAKLYLADEIRKAAVVRRLLSNSAIWWSSQANGICERFHRTLLDEFYRVAFRKKIYRAIDEL